MNELIEQMGNVYYQMYPMAYHKVITTIYTELAIGVIGVVMLTISAAVCRKADTESGKFLVFFVIGIFGFFMFLGLPSAVYGHSNFDYYVTTTAVQMITGGTK